MRPMKKKAFHKNRFRSYHGGNEEKNKSAFPQIPAFRAECRKGQV
ncbi:hypothetical protein HMPREF1986_01553 [Oribacterium sp. oral taxon 078 str. F0263]|nr:hypothetical protein HMPREF1986_01553 [Oribacterium sp. oral taxon 078 str. F0263]